MIGDDWKYAIAVWIGSMVLMGVAVGVLIATAVGVIVWLCF